MLKSTPVFSAAWLASATVIPARSGIVTSCPCSAIRNVTAADTSITTIIANATIATLKYRIISTSTCPLPSPYRRLSVAGSG